MDRLKEILTDIDWRFSELSIIKTLPYKYSFSEEHRNILIKYSIPSIYSVWEGFINSSFHQYIGFLNDQKLSPQNCNINLLTHHFDNECQLNNPRTNFEKKVKLVRIINSISENTIIFSYKLPTESNISFRVANKMLQRFNIEQLPKDKYETPLNRLLLFRNKIAHGENSILVQPDDMRDFSFLVLELMQEIFIRIEDSIKGNKYLCN